MFTWALKYLGASRWAGRIQFEFNFKGARYRPSLNITPSEANLRRARERRQVIKQRIAAGTFAFAEEFPDFHGLEEVPYGGSPRSCCRTSCSIRHHPQSSCGARSSLAIAITLMSKIRLSASRVHGFESGTDPSSIPLPCTKPRRSSPRPIATGARRRATTTSSGSSPVCGLPRRSHS